VTHKAYRAEIGGRQEQIPTPRALRRNEFFNSTQYALEFGFQRTLLPDRAYPYPPALADWMERNGYVKAPLGAEDAATGTSGSGD
jgi:hypothetical protein